jgi:hypothetical protein
LEVESCAELFTAADAFAVVGSSTIWYDCDHPYQIQEREALRRLLSQLAEVDERTGGTSPSLPLDRLSKALTLLREIEGRS